MFSLVITMDKYDTLNFLKHLKDWRNNNCSTLDRENALHLFLQGLNLPTHFIGRLEKVKTEMTMEQLRDQMP